ncbi:MAG: NAD(P)-dependent oxidoreductase [Anaerolineales bacterium]|nr:NAD(P)-dependent oxidoreductase [Anaerolineales bacterium]
MNDNTLTVGMIGIGAMGTPMSRNLIKAGFPLTVFDRNLERLKPLQELGAKTVSSCAEVSRGVDVVITVIGTVQDELEVVLGQDGVLEGAHPDLTLIDCSTVGIVATSKMAAAAAERGVAFIDATISGSTGPAAEGTLGFMVGAYTDDLERIRPVLLAMGEKIHHMGPPGAGSAMKVMINLMIGMTVLTVAETLTLGRKAGLDPEQMIEVLSETSVRSPHLSHKGRMMIERNFEPAFMLKYMQKDFDLIMEAAHALRMPAFTSAIAHQVYTAANVAGYGDLDYSSVVRFLERVAGLNP